jgi:predicted metal-dependent HD superfamily phosphohydrolase
VTEKMPLSAAAEPIATEFITAKVPEKYAYHDIHHTRNVVQVSLHIAETLQLSDPQIDLLGVAAWFHDMGYDGGASGHEERGCTYATEFLKQKKATNADIELVCGCIRATKMPQKPNNLFEQIICDADLSHLGEKTYWKRSASLREELRLCQDKNMTESEWVDFELNFILNHNYHTAIAKELFEDRKMKHISKLHKQKERLNPNESLTPDDAIIQAKEKEREKHKKWKAVAKKNEQEVKQLRLGRGVETMYRTTYNTHNNLSAQADHKANLMLSINTIMISITFSSLVPRLKDDHKLIIPTVAVLLVSLTAIVLATLSTRPKITTGIVTKADIEQKKSNLLFFGNFFNMKLEEYQWGMNEMINDPDFQYASMTRDLYFLGRVLAQKYKLLTYCYNVFMYGMIAVVLLFAAALAFG